MPDAKTILSQDLRWAKIQLDPTCSKCRIRKTPADFPRNAVDYWCSRCRSDYAIDLYRKKVASLSPLDLAKFRDKVSERQSRQRDARIASMPKKQLEAWRMQINAGNTMRRYEVRDRVYRAYGGYVCACCGETEKAFLSIDHIENDGATHKRKFNLKTGEQMYRWLARNNFPSGFQILCMNCQWGKRNNGGICPHQVRCNDHPVEGVGPSGPKRSAPV
jgi:hypothetical protein